MKFTNINESEAVKKPLTFKNIENLIDDWLLINPVVLKVLESHTEEVDCPTVTLQLPELSKCTPEYLEVKNFLSEFKTKNQKLKVKENLGIVTDSELSLESVNPVANSTITSILLEIRNRMNSIEEVVEGTNPDTIDSFNDIIQWISNHGDVSDIIGSINANTEKIEAEIERALAAENELKEITGVKWSFLKKPYSERYFTIEVLEDCIFNLVVPTAANAIKYKLNDNDWVTTDTNVDITCLANDTVQLSCVCPSRYSGEDTMRNHHFGLRVPFNAYGNVMSLIYGDDFAEQYTLNSNNVFDSLFHMLPIISAKNLVLPATTLSEHCYANMFYYCQMLTETPQLPATTLAKGCYKNMFGFCTTLTQAPELMADIVAQECYYQMFYGCEALTKAPSILPSMTLDYACYFEMFRECYALTTLPELPATTLAESCYEYMFDSCSEINSTMELPSTVLTKRCYYGMFNYCTNLTTAPQLKATTLADECYKNMFKSCSNLTTISELPATTLANNCYESMFEGCKKLTTAPQLKSIKMGVSSCQYMFKGCTSLTEAPELIATTLASNCYNGMFENCKALESTIDLPATTLAEGCYNSMFKGCTNLTNVIELKATTLAESCYKNMFYNCTSLTTVPKLKATTLANECYYRMFYNTNVIPSYPIEIFTNETIVHSGGLKGLFSKTKITDNDLMNILPINSEGKYYLPVLTLANNCYDYMFENCSYLTTSPELPATNNIGSGGYSTIFNGCNSLISGPSILPATSLSTRCYYNMFNGCVSLVNAPELPAMTLAEGCYESMFYGCHSLLTAPELKSVRLPKTCYQSMFNGCLRLNNITMLGIKYSTNSLSHWVSGVGYEGNFIKAKSASLPSGVNGIPENWSIDEIDVDYEIDYSKEYFTIEALEDGLTVKLSRNASYYCIDNGNWVYLPATSTTTTSINKGQTIQFRITNPTISSSYGIGTFTVNKKFNVNGNIMSLLYGDNFEGQIDLTGKNYAFSQLFSKCTTLQNAENLILPATTLASSCYYFMFAGCTSLTEAPELPATTLAEYCYQYMFNGCSNLTTAPELPATRLTNGCYYQMFFSCTSLTEAPQLPATTLANHCYQYMFSDCTNLTTAPELPATTLAGYCYYGMFRGCSKLNYIKMLATKTNISEVGFLTNWVSGVASTGTFIKHPNMTTLPSGANGIPNGWTVTNTFNNISPCFINKASESITFVYSDGLFTPTNEIIDLSQYFTKEELLSVQPECEITVTFHDKTDNVLASDYVWVNDKTLSDVLKELGITKDVYDINVIITKVNAPEDSGYYYYNTIEETPCLKEYFTIEALEDDLTVQLSRNASYYRIDDGEWISLAANTATPSIDAKQKISFKIANPTISSSYGIGTFTVNKAFNIEGNIMSLLYGDNFEGQIDLSGKGYAFYNLFYNCTTLKNAKNLILPATTLADKCYTIMFGRCTSLTEVPELPATTLADGCYTSMFINCTSLTTAPSILPATILASKCYQSMFSSCSSLTEAPELPATTLADGCYFNMFQGCTSLTVAPELPAITLASECYRDMFDGCKNLTTTPQLPATTLANSCYAYMFRGCSKLNKITMLATDISVSGCLNNWVSGVASTGTFVKNAAMTSLPSGNSGIPNGWTVENA